MRIKIKHCQTIVPWMRCDDDECGGVSESSLSLESVFVMIGTVRVTISFIGSISSGGVT